MILVVFFFFSSRRRHTRSLRDWSSDVCSSDLWQHTDRLFMIIKAADDYPRRGASDAAQADSARWEAYMATFQRALPDAAAGEKWLPMRRIFALADHIGLSRS